MAEGDVISIALLNAAGDILVTAGVPIVDPKMIGRMKSRELWDPSNLTVVRWVDLGGS